VPAHQEAFNRLSSNLAEASSSREVDHILDEWYDIDQRATEWDADLWGLREDLILDDLAVEHDHKHMST
jgi:hypothetical protein